MSRCWLVMLIGTLWLACGQDRVRIENLACECQVEPLGIDEPAPRLSWQIRTPRRGWRQSAYRVLVASSDAALAQDRGDLWDSGPVRSDACHQIAYQGSPLGSNQACVWKVMVWDQQNLPSTWSRPSRWCMALLRNDDWQSHWIGCADTVLAHGLPILRKVFNIEKPVHRAIVHVSGLGQYVLSLNGRQVGDHFLDPAWSVYEKTVYYNTFAIRANLRRGENVFGVMLGKGFYNTQGDRRVHGVRSNRPLKLILQALIEYDDGSVQLITSDSTWSVQSGPYTHDAILAGSDYDARRLPRHWDHPGFDDSAWPRAIETDGPGGQLIAATAPALTVHKVLQAQKIDQPEPGYFVYDFGQNASALPRLTVRGQAGHSIRLTPAEQRHGGSPQTNDGTGRVNQAGVGQPNYWQYTLAGEDVETWQPAFTYGGFQYLEVSGAVPAGAANPQGLPVIEELVSLHVRNDSPRCGAFSCSNTLFNRIYALIDWAVASNLSHVLTDCPHREKLGWLEVSYLMGPAIARNYDVARFYAKKTRDIRDSQDSDGQIFTVAPNYPVFQGGFRYTPEWGAAGVLLPWQLYQWYGDRRVLQENYPAMKRFVDFMEATSEDLMARSGLGDWYDYGHGGAMGASRFTPVDLTATATFYACAGVLARSAEVLGQDRDQAHYRALAAKIRSAFNGKFFNGRDAYLNHGSPQTANAMALVLGLADSSHSRAILETIVTDLQQRGYQQTAGDIGFYYLVEALAGSNRHEDLYRNTNRHAEGSYGFILDHGWTSMPEAWNANTGASMNHCMLGHIQLWFAQDLLGIRQADDKHGFQELIIQPAFLDSLSWVKGHYDTPYGRVSVDWVRQQSGLRCSISVPANSSALVCLPGNAAGDWSESGQALKESRGIHDIHSKNGRLDLKIGSGAYVFRRAAKH